MEINNVVKRSKLPRKTLFSLLFALQNKPKPLVRIQKWVSDWINECMHNQRKIFLFCYYTDSDLDNDWQNKASMCIGEALHVASSHSCSGANGRAMSVRRSMGIKLQKGKK